MNPADEIRPLVHSSSLEAFFDQRETSRGRRKFKLKLTNFQSTWNESHESDVSPSMTPRKIQKPTIFPYFFQCSGLIASLLSTTAYSFWILANEIIQPFTVFGLSMVGLAASLMLSYGMDYLSKNESSFLRPHRYLFLGIQFNTIITGISALFLIPTQQSCSMTILTIALLTLALSAITGMIYDIHLDRENHKNHLTLNLSSSENHPIKNI